MLTKEQYSMFSSVLFFDNHLKDEKANYVSFTDGYLWRRDDARLIAYKTKEKSEKTFSFSVEAFEKDGANEVHLISEGILLKNEEMQKNINAVEVPFKSNSINVLQVTDFDWEVDIDTKSMAKALMMIQRKLMNQTGDIGAVSVIVDYKERTIKIEHLADAVYDFKGEIKNEGQEPCIRYSFLLFKDFFMNAKAFGKQVKILINEAYFTRIQYNENVIAILNHKRKKAKNL